MATVPGTSVELASRSPEATGQLAQQLATVAQPGDVVCLWGELGAGKTVFAKGFGLGLGIRDTISSPTFVLMGEYAGRLPLFHIDLYRLASSDDAREGGLLDDRQSEGVVLIEWPDRLGDAIPASRLDVHIEGADGMDGLDGMDGRDGGRRILLEARGWGYGRYIAAAPHSLDRP